MTKRLVAIVVAILSSILNWYVFNWIAARLFHSQDPAMIATVIVTSIVAHELGHLIVLEYYGIKCYFYLAVIVGATMPYKKYVSKYDRLHWFGQTAVALAGVSMNLLLIVAGWVLWRNEAMSDAYFGTWANINALNILWNLIPFGIMDGGRFAKAFFDSVPENQDLLFAQAIAAVVIVASVVGAVCWRTTAFLPVWLLVLRINRSATEDDPNGSTSPKAMTHRQQVSWATAYVLLAGLSILIVSASAKMSSFR